MGNPLSSLLSTVSNGGGGSFPIPPDLLRSYLQKQPAYEDNRERAAVVLDQGFKAYDGYVKAKPFLFYGSIASAVFSGFALYKRRKKGTEAIVLHSANLIASVVVAFVTRPGTTPKAPPGTPPGDVAGYNVIATLDAKRAALKKQDPKFADKVFFRLSQMPGVREELAKSPVVAAVVG